MAIVKGKRFRRDHPIETGVWFEFSELGFVTKQHARDVRQQAQFAGIRAMGGEVFREITKVDPEEIKREAAAVANPDDAYDTYIILSQGIVSWSYPDPVTPDNIAGLDERTSEWAKHAILQGSEIRPLVSESALPLTGPSITQMTPSASFPMNGSYPASASLSAVPQT